ncbi:MAG: cupredoxin domain-containing protein [Candidatus Dormibacteria bacterium]
MRVRGMMTAAAIGVIVSVSGCGNGPPTASGGSTGSASVGSAAASGLGSPAAKVLQTAALHFDPNSTTVKVGQVIEWTNSGAVPHNVTFDQYTDLTSSTMQQGDTWEVKFTTPGSYAYHCTFHPGMDGTITVNP